MWWVLGVLVVWILVAIPVAVLLGKSISAAEREEGQDV